jgi:Ca2+/Na+ antiporter
MKILIWGLLIAQLIATLHVYNSNNEFHSKLVSIKNAGYLTIPNCHIIERLPDFRVAFLGGLFFTFSIGAGISFLSLALAWTWDRMSSRKVILIYFFFLIWLGFLLAVNYNGYKILITLYFLIIPPVVFAIATNHMSYLNKKNKRSNETFHLIPVIILALLYGWQIDSRMFTDFRDLYLLSNPLGSKINEFYYRYTLYPAEILKSLDQKMLKTSTIESKDGVTKQRLENIFLNHDYIPIKPNIETDLKLVSLKDEFILNYEDTPVLRISSKEFFANPDKAIKEFEKKTDSNNLLRMITFVSLLIGFPTAVYVIAHGSISLLVNFVVKPSKTSLIATGFCFAICIILMFAFQLSRGRDVSAQNLSEAMSSQNWRTRVAALKFIEEKGLEVSQFKNYPELLSSAQIAERYWLVRTLGNSKNPATYPDLLNFLNDVHPNIVTMTLYAIGKRGNRDTIDQIKQIIATSDHWYIQWYAYRALRSIGWRQTKSKQAP